MRDFAYDFETYKNCFSTVFIDVHTDNQVVFEMSDFKNDWGDFVAFIEKCSKNFIRFVGFNNYYFDYPVLHHLLHRFKGKNPTGSQVALEAYWKGQKLIKCTKEEKFAQVIWDNNQVVPQLDLYRIHHFDNVARSTSLKVLEYNMRSDQIEDLPYSPHEPLNQEQIKRLIRYNIHDVKQTVKFYHHTTPMIKFREELTEKYGKNFINHNDTKIGKDYFIMELENAGVKCYYFDDGERKPVQTKRDKIIINDIIFPYVEFDRPEFNAVLDWLRRQRITETKGVFTEIDDFGSLEAYANLKKTKGKFKNLNCIVDGFQFDFGTGGIHGSIKPEIVSECDNFAILDFDVTSLYPSIAIVNNVYPKHLTTTFCSVYSQLKDDRVSYPKGTPENAMLKLALNGVYGDSNNKYSPFYDPQYTMTITINGQLMLCMLAEKLMGIDQLRLLQINTDGLTVKVPRSKIDEVESINREWERITKLDLERADYSRMFIRDVNNYVAEYTDGKLKRKGKYEYELEWHQNHSSLVVQKAVEANLIHGQDIRDFIDNHDNVFDFMLRVKVPRGSRLMFGDQQIQNTTRYYISDSGKNFTKIMPPLKRKPEQGERHFRINAGWKGVPVNDMRIIDHRDILIDIDTNWYVEEAEKLTKPMYDGTLKQMMS